MARVTPKINIFASLTLPRLIPIASIVTPATLSVEAAVKNPLPSKMSKVPVFDFTNLNFIAGMPSGDDFGPTNYCFQGGNIMVERIASAVVPQGRILQITPPAPNATWSLDFWGPSLECIAVEGQQRYDIWSNVYRFLNNGTNCYLSYGYLACLPTSTGYLPFANESGSMTFRTDDLTYGVPARLLVGLIPQMFNRENSFSTEIIPGACVMWDGGGGATTTASLENNAWAEAFFNDSTLLSCELLNRSQKATFEYVNGDQTVVVTADTSTNSTPVVPVDCVTGPALGDQEGIGQMQIQQQATWPNCSTLNVNGQQCSFDPEVVRLLSFQGIASVFNRLLIGTIGLGGIDAPTPFLDPDSSVLGTMLLDTLEFSFIKNYSTRESFPQLQDQINSESGSEYPGLSSPVSTGSRGNLKDALETLFQNVTISLLSEQYLQCVIVCNRYRTSQWLTIIRLPQTEFNLSVRSAFIDQRNVYCLPQHLCVCGTDTLDRIWNCYLLLHTSSWRRWISACSKRSLLRRHLFDSISRSPNS